MLIPGTADWNQDEINRRQAFELDNQEPIPPKTNDGQYLMMYIIVTCAHTKMQTSEHANTSLFQPSAYTISSLLHSCPGLASILAHVQMLPYLLTYLQAFKQTSKYLLACLTVYLFTCLFACCLFCMFTCLLGFCVCMQTNKHANAEATKQVKHAKKHTC